VSAPIALIGVAEKGYASFELSLRAAGGHSSMPPPHGALGRLAAAIVRLEDEPMPAELRGPAAAMIDRLTPEMGFGPRLALANRWLLDPLIVRVLARHPASNAIVRTTTAPTMFAAGTADNVLAARARAVVNFRILPGDTVADVEAHIRAVMGDPDIEVACVDRCWEPSPPSPTHGPGWDHLQAAIAWSWPDAVVSPSLVVGATDARYYVAVTDRVYRFAPLRLDDRERERLHGTDERIALENLERAVKFYQWVVLTATR
jgi:carboxypeptidase PM20D1